jgi:hypothetical protein
MDDMFQDQTEIQLDKYIKEIKLVKQTLVGTVEEKLNKNN